MKQYKIRVFLFCVAAFFMLLCLITAGYQRISGNQHKFSLPWAKQEAPLSDTTFALNTYITITLYDKQEQSLIDHCFDMIDEYENMFSRTLDYSEISRINQSFDSEIPLSEDTETLINIALDYARKTDGALDPTIGAVSPLWDFSSGTNHPTVPDSARIQSALPHIGYKGITVQNHALTKKDTDTALDMGAIAKGYIADQLKDYLTGQGVTSGIINLGGNVLCIGNKPDGETFRIGIQKPFEAYQETIGQIAVSDCSVVSSGIYERFFQKDGRLYHHILDPSTGYPVENNLIAVTVISPHSVDGDALTTSCMVLGLEKGTALVESTDGTYAVFITQDYELHFTEGFVERWSFEETE